ncbi:catalase [Lysobacter sp. TY2-98]|uniref:catalase n=1 Tax=Lysobacter sp. TY2-98 TaxID=2290922 RepID=UPI000E201A6A|nr:catalase [Lysobacter sp. TY2-98]AXK72688.1 catalase [Lysobacter sp. TY2-98]
MATKKSAGKASPTRKSASSRATGGKAAARKTDSGSAKAPPPGTGDAAAEKMAQTQQVAAAMPTNTAKASEYAKRGALPVAPEGDHVGIEPIVGASTLSEVNVSDKTGAPAALGENPTVDPLDRVRVDSTGQAITTNQGVPVADNQNSLKAGVRGPALLKDFILREKITHFDHERIPERVVHARGSAAHGFFECYEPLTDLTVAAPFQAKGKRTPVFVRFSTVAGERGSKDTARDVRGFAVKFYTEQGNWDLVGNNIPVFFIQDAMKFPDLVHAVKPEPHHAMPQAASAHDTFWDFVSLMPESTHMLLWQMSDRAIPRSYRTMQGFGVHTFRLVNAKGRAVFVKFHWTPVLGTHSLVWDEAVKISGADPDYHRRDLWEAIEAGAYPEYELGLQVFTEEQAESFSFDVLDATKLVPEELVPLRTVGRLVLDRNPDNFFAETEQVAFCTAHVVPGIDFTNDPLLAGRIHSYVDTQITRLGGPNFHEIPINAPIAPVHNNQRDGLHRQAIHRGRVSYEPNSLAGGCPFQAGAAGFVAFPEPIDANEVRGKPEKFAEHFNQARLFFDSQTPIEQAHIIAAFRFELSKVTVPAVRERVVSMLANVSDVLAEGVASGLGMDVPAPMPPVLAKPPKPEVAVSDALSLLARPGDGSIRTRQIAIVVADGVDGATVTALQSALLDEGAVPRLVGPRIGPVRTADGEVLDADASLENEPAFLFDAMVLPDGDQAVDALLANGRMLEGLKDQYRHCKTILALGASQRLVEAAGLPTELPDGTPDPGLLVMDGDDTDAALEAFVAAVSQHRHWDRETDPPRV